MFSPGQITNSPPPTSIRSNISPPQISPSDRKSSGGLHPRSCVTCRRRKVKCDKSTPCSNCTRAGCECVFPAPGRAPRRPRAGPKVATEREAELLKRLRRLEGVVEELSGQVEVESIKHSPGSEFPSTPKDGEPADNSNGKVTYVRVVGMDEGSGNRKEWLARAFRTGDGPPKTAFAIDEVNAGVGRLVLDEGKSRYLASPFWASISDEVEEIKDMLNDQEYESDSDAPILPSSCFTDPDHQSFIMGYNSSGVNLKALHPLPSQIPFYWETFLENVNPLVKLIHVPTMNPVIKQVQNNLDSLSKSTEALMFAIYFATVTSMNADEVKLNFGVTKESLVKQYRFGVEQALARAGFLNTNEIVTVQAFVLFLLCVRRHDDSRFVWSLTGLALRVAQALGLHRDGSSFGLSFFDAEMRRRLWWQLCVLDTRASEDHGTDPSILDFSFDTKFPLSINDEDLIPNATEPPVPRKGVSEMTFCLIRYEICQLARKIVWIPPSPALCILKASLMTLEKKEEIVRQTAEHLQVTYLQYCENAGPLYWVAATVARLVMAKMSLLIYHQMTHPGKSNDLSQEVKDRLFVASIEIIEYSRILEFEATTKKWGWLFQTYIQWHAIAFILTELCARDNSELVDRAWDSLDIVFEHWGTAITHTRSGMLWQPLRKLMARAKRRRQQLLQNGNCKLKTSSTHVHPTQRATNYPTMTLRDIPSEQVVQQSIETSTNPDLNSNIPNQYSLHQDFPQQDQNMMQSQMTGMGGMGPQQIPIDQTAPWSMDDPALLDMDMATLDGEANWEGWDEMVRDFQMGQNPTQDPVGMGRGPNYGGVGQWW